MPDNTTGHAPVLRSAVTLHLHLHAQIIQLGGKARNDETPLQVVLSTCEGNTLSAHLVGDMVCLLLAAAQIPWLCTSQCSFWAQASCATWLIMQVCPSPICLGLRAHLQI